MLIASNCAANRCASPPAKSPSPPLPPPPDSSIALMQRQGLKRRPCLCTPSPLDPQQRSSRLALHRHLLFTTRPASATLRFLRLTIPITSATINSPASLRSDP